MDNKDIINFETCVNNHREIIGNSINFDVSPCMPDSEVRADVTVGERRAIRVWGQIKDCQGRPVNRALLKLVRKINVCGKERYIGIAHTVCDCDGFYQFDVCVDERGSYKILVGKSDNGGEIIIPESRQGCDPCDDDYCDEYDIIIPEDVPECTNPCDEN